MTEAAADGVANDQGTGEYGCGSGHGEGDGEVDPPMLEEAGTDEVGG